VPSRSAAPSSSAWPTPPSSRPAGAPPNCATRLSHAFVKGDLTIFDKDLLSSRTSAGYDQGNQVTADATMVQQAIAKLKGELPPGG
jgi:hypothetical protein